MYLLPACNYFFAETKSWCLNLVVTINHLTSLVECSQKISENPKNEQACNGDDNKCSYVGTSRHNHDAE